MDFIKRGMISSGQLKQPIEEDGLRGVTSTPSIFEKTIAGCHDYDDAKRGFVLLPQGGERGDFCAEGELFAQDQSLRSSVRYWMASPMWEESILSAPARSAIVRETLRMRS